MKKMLFVLPLLAAFVMMGAPVASAATADDVMAAIADPEGLRTIGSLSRGILDELRSYYADLNFQLLDEFSGGSRTVGWLSRETFNAVSDINAQLIDPASGSYKDGGHTIGSLLRLSVTEQRDLQADVDALQLDVQQLQSSVDEVIALLKTPQGRRSSWNE